jgi:osmotically-inducible protein OsmY
MTNPKPLYALGSLLILTAALPGCATFRECGSNACADDAKISANLQTQLDRRPELGPPHSVDVRTIDHVVYLNGSVNACLDSETAESVADEAPGVARVVNDIAVAH